MQPAKHNYTVLQKICQHIPAHLVAKLSRDYGVDNTTARYKLKKTGTSFR